MNLQENVNSSSRTSNENKWQKIFLGESRRPDDERLIIISFNALQ